MSSLLTLGLVTLVMVGCATPYGEETVSKDEPAGVETSTSKEKRKTTTTIDGASPAPAKTAESAPATTTTTTTTSTSEQTPAAIAASPNAVTLTWGEATSESDYSFDLVLRSGKVVGPCISVEHIGRSHEVTFRGECPSSMEHAVVPFDQVYGFQICAAEYGDWSHATCERSTWDGVSTSMAIEFD